MNPRLDVLLSRTADEAASADEWNELESILSADPAARRRYVQMMDLHSELRARHARAISPEAAESLSQSRCRFAWLPWSPLTTAAAGIVFGMLCTSAVFAYMVPSLKKPTKLLQESFESGPAPTVTGLPTEVGMWSGDYTEVVGEDQGVKPESGQRMLRMLRADHEGKTNAQASRAADIYRLIDVRPYRQDYADGSAVVQLSAAFNAFLYPQGEDYIGKMTLHAFDGETATSGALRTASVREESSLASASAGPVRLYRNPNNWRRLTSDLRLPANTDFLLIHLTISAGRGTLPKTGFGGHYIDDVRLTLRHSPLQ